MTLDAFQNFGVAGDLWPLRSGRVVRVPTGSVIALR